MTSKHVSWVRVNGRDVIFIRTPKNASRAIGRALGMENDKRHLAPSECVNLVGRRKWNTAFTVAFMRHPLDRIASWYRYHRHTMHVIRDDWKVWIRKGMPVHSDWRGKPYPLSQLPWIETVDFLGKVETMELSWKALNSELGADMKPPSPVNVSHAVPEVKWSKDIRALLPRWVRNECDMLGYDFEQPGELKR